MAPLPAVGGYRLLEEVGAGGMGVVYSAAAPDGRKVAIKVVRPENVGVKAAERILREVHALSTVSHPGVVAYIDHGVTDQDVPYLVTEWLEGFDLEECLHRGPLPISRVRAMAIRLAGALAAAHECGVVHRDIKPANIFLVDGRPEDARLLDFGIARSTARTWTLTSPGFLVGTPGYMSPEQARGDADVDHRADLFSLGCVLYECLGGVPPFPGEHVMAVLAKVLVESPRRLGEVVPDVDPQLEELVSELLHKDPARRPSTARELLRRLQTRTPGKARPRRHSLTDEEQAFHSVMLIRGEVEPEGSSQELERLAERHLGRHIMLIDGTRLVHMRRVGVVSDLAVNAARCALALRAHSSQLTIAVVSGLAMVTGRSAMGQVLDRGADLLTVAAEGEIRVDEVTAGLLDARFEIQRDEGGLLLSAVLDDRLAPQTDATIIGRRRELAVLEAAYLDCIEDLGAAAVVVMGEAGMGKSRIRRELRTRLMARGAPVPSFLVGRADPMRMQAPFSLISRLIHESAGLEDGEPASVRRDKLRGRLGRHLAEDDLAGVLPFLGELVSAHPDEAPVELELARESSAVMRERIEQAWVGWLRAECEAGPVVLELEDLHWADAATIGLVDSALEALEGCPLMVVACSRPEVEQRFPALWEGHGVEFVSLGPLPRRSAAKLVRRVLGDVATPAEVDRIVDCGRGNALFLEELSRALVGGSDHDLPGSVLGMMQHRLAVLSTLERRVLRAASVFGRVAESGGILELVGSDTDAAQLEDALTKLVGDQWLIVTRPRADAEPSYAFRHDLVRDAVYATLTQRDREVGHRLAARWLVASGESDAIVVAEHYQRGSDPAGATEWFANAVDQAFDRADFDVLRQIVDRSLPEAPPGDSRGRLLLRRAEVHAVSGRHQEAAELALAALDHLRPHSPRWYNAAGEAALASARAGEHHRVSEIVDALMTIEPTEGGSAVDLVGLVRATLPLAAAGEAAAAWCLADTVVRVTSMMARDDPEASGPLHSARTIRAIVTGALDTAYREASLAAAAFERVGSLRNALEHLATSGFVLLELGCLEQAEKTLRRTVDSSVDLSLEHVRAVARHNLGRRVGEAGRIEEGLELEYQALAGFESHRNGRMQGLTSCHIAWLLLLDERPDEAAEHVESAMERLRDHPASQLMALATRARVRLRLGDPQGALEDARRAVESLESLGRLQEGESFIRLTWAETLEQSGQRSQARVAIAAARKNLGDRAARIVHEELRASFLTRVWENARTDALAREWGGVEADSPDA